MTKQLTLDEMLDCIEMIGDNELAAVFARQLEAIGDHMANHLAARLKVDCGSTSREESAFAGTCCAFFPAAPGDPCPEPLVHFDSSQWEDDETGDWCDRPLVSFAHRDNPEGTRYWAAYGNKLPEWAVGVVEEGRVS